MYRITKCAIYKNNYLLHEKYSSVLISLHHEVTTRFNRRSRGAGGVW